jgi:hypothetical protein
MLPKANAGLHSVHAHVSTNKYYIIITEGTEVILQKVRLVKVFME